MLEKTFEIDGSFVTATAIIYVSRDCTEERDGILIHDENDNFRDGDAIYDGNLEWIETAGDLLNLLEDYGETVFHVMPNGVYYAGEPMTAYEIAENLWENADNGDPITLKQAAEILDNIRDWPNLPEGLTAEDLKDAYNGYIDDCRHTQCDSNDKHISINNGNTYYGPDETACAIADLADKISGDLDSAWTVIENAMDDETREKISDEHAPCNYDEFLAHYLKAAPEDLVIG